MIKTFMRYKISAAVLLGLAVIAVSCNPSKKYEEEEKSIIADYVAEHDITVSPDKHGLYYIEVTPGNGAFIETGDSVGVHYKLTLLDGKEIDSNLAPTVPFRFRVGSYVIDGWSIGLTYMQLGTKAKLLVPSKLAYGSTGYSMFDPMYGYITLIPGYSPLLFDIEVVELIKARK